MTELVRWFKQAGSRSASDTPVLPCPRITVLSIWPGLFFQLSRCHRQKSNKQLEGALPSADVAPHLILMAAQEKNGNLLSKPGIREVQWLHCAACDGWCAFYDFRFFFFNSPRKSLLTLLNVQLKRAAKYTAKWAGVRTQPSLTHSTLDLKTINVLSSKCMVTFISSCNDTIILSSNGG